MAGQVLLCLKRDWITSENSMLAELLDQSVPEGKPYVITQ